MEYPVACNFTIFRYIDKNIMLLQWFSLYQSILAVYLGIYVLCHENNY